MKCPRSSSQKSELLQFSLNPVNVICIQESNLNSSSGISVLRSDRTHSRSGMLSPDDHTLAVVLFLSGKEYELSTSSLSSLAPFYDYKEINISLNNSFSLCFFNIYARPSCSS